MTNPHSPEQKGNSEVFQDGRPVSESAAEVCKAEGKKESLESNKEEKEYNEK
jgi:hypothetical protein